MKKARLAILLVLFLFFTVNLALAAQASGAYRLAPITQTQPATKTDLSFTPWPVPAMLEQPTEGDPLFYHQISFSLTNASSVPSPAATVKVTCEALEGGTCPSGLSGIIKFDALSPHTGQGTSWPTEMGQTWPKGKFKLTFVIDPDNKIPESNKNNNSFSQVVEVKVKPIVEGVTETGTGTDVHVPTVEELNQATELNPQPEPPIYDTGAGEQKLQKR